MACGAGVGTYSGAGGGVGSGGGDGFGFDFGLGGRGFGRCRIRVPIFAVAAGASGMDFGGWGVLSGLRATRTGFAFGSPTSAPSGGGSGALSSPGSSRTPSIATRTIAATRATPRHLILTPLIPSQGT